MRSMPRRGPARVASSLVQLVTPIETGRLRLRPFHDDRSDVEAMLAVLGDRESMRFYPAPFDREATLAWIDRQLERYERDGYGLLAIEDRATGEVIGDCGPTVQEADGGTYVELGWHVLASRQRRGIATEAGAACRDAAFAELGTPFVISLIRPENTPSRRVATKLGFDIWRGTIRAGWGHLIYRLDRPT
jgi:[ribosomal protein S5]-alanine N-acetyltransferase